MREMDPTNMASSEDDKGDNITDFTGAVVQNRKSNKNVFDRESDNEEIVSVKCRVIFLKGGLYVHFFYIISLHFKSVRVCY